MKHLVLTGDQLELTEWTAQKNRLQNMSKRKTIISDYFIAILERLKDEIAEKSIKKKKVLFHENNALFPKLTNYYKLRFELLPHSPYFPDLVHSEFFCSFNRCLLGGNFALLVIAATKSYFTKIF